MSPLNGARLCLITLVNPAGEQFEPGVAVVVANGQFIIGAGEQSFHRGRGAALVRAADVFLHARDGELVEGYLRRKGIGIRIQERLVGIFLAKVAKPFRRLGHAIVLIEKIDGVAQEIPLGRLNAILLVGIGFFGIPGFVGVIDLGDKAKVGVKVVRFVKGVDDQPPVVECLEQGLVKGAPEHG